MPSYLVERSIPIAGELTAVELKQIVRQSLCMQQRLRSRIQWLQAIITADRMVCLYTAENEAFIREHVWLSGLPDSRICELSAVIGPALDGLETL